MSDDSAEKLACIAEEARRKADEAAEQARAQADRVKGNALTGEGGEEAVKQDGLIYGGLIGIAVVIVQGFLEAPSRDTPARVSIVAFAVAIPLLAALVMVNRQESFRRRRTPSVTVTSAKVVAQGAAPRRARRQLLAYLLDWGSRVPRRWVRRLVRVFGGVVASRARSGPVAERRAV
jgi:hypothetical protein